MLNVVNYLNDLQKAFKVINNVTIQWVKRNML